MPTAPLSVPSSVGAHQIPMQVQTVTHDVRTIDRHCSSQALLELPLGVALVLLGYAAVLWALGGDPAQAAELLPAWARAV